MNYYLITYNRKAGRVEDLAAFSAEDRDEALRRRFILEETNRNNPNVEVVVIGAQSEEVLRVTHARYFKSPKELIGG